MTPQLTFSYPVVAQRPSGSKRATRNFLNNLIPNPTTSAIGILSLLLATTWGLRLLEALTTGRPYCIFYLISIALAAALVGVRFALAASAISVALAYAFLFHNIYHAGGVIELSALAVGSVGVTLAIAKLRHVTDELKSLNESLVASETRRTSFNREVLLAVTGGRMSLFEPSEMPSQLTGQKVDRMELHNPGDAFNLRHKLRDLGQAKGMEGTRLSDLETAVTEAATNAIKHANGGTAEVYSEGSTIAVLISDNGHGISPTDLARATLERGFSSLYSLGMGFTMILDAVDSMALATSQNGTQILIRVSNNERPMQELNLLTRYDLGEYKPRNK